MSQPNLAAPPHHTAAAASAEGSKKLLIVGLCGEIIEVDWEPEDTVASIKCKAFTAAENALLADARSLVQGARVRTDVTAQAATTLIYISLTPGPMCWQVFHCSSCGWHSAIRTTFWVWTKRCVWIIV